MKEQETILADWKRRGLRLTRTRRSLVMVFLERAAPLAAAHILRDLAKQSVKVNKTTVYRELERLEGLGLLRSVQLGDRKKYYELAGAEHHHHLVCLACERVQDVDINEQDLVRQEKQCEEEKRFKIVRHALEFFGVCQECQPLTVSNNHV